MRTRVLFVVIFLVALVVQTIIWQRVDIVDHEFWEERSFNVWQDLTAGSFSFRPDRHPYHPAMTVILAAGILYRFGYPVGESLEMSAALVVAFLCASAVVLARRLSSGQQWPIALAGALLLHRFYDTANLIDAVISLLFVVIFLLLLQHHQERQQTPRWTSVALGLALGAALATRIHLALPLVISVVPLLALAVTRQRVALVSITTVVMMVIANPLMWSRPLHFLYMTLFYQFAVVTQPVGEAAAGTQIGLTDIAWASPLSVIALALLLSAWWWRTQSVIPRSFIITSLAATAAVVIVIELSAIESMRYYYPLLLSWEGFFPLLFYTGLQHVPGLLHFNGSQRRFVETSVTALYILGHGITLASLLFPEWLWRWM